MSTITIALIVAAYATGLYVWYVSRARRMAVDRLADMIEIPAGIDDREPVAHRTIRRFPPRYQIIAPAAGVLAALFLWFALSVPMAIAAAFGTLLAVVVSLIESHAAQRQEALIETQLAAAIDLMVGSVRAGASLLAAFESTLQEVESPLRPYLQDVAGRIRLGDDPRGVVSGLQERVPLETFQLFATSLAIHWEVGGSLATTLATVGKTIRDRIELSRRVKAQGIESNASVAVVMLISYVLAFLMWRTNPDRIEAFVNTGLGTVLVTGVIALQAFGLIWMSRLSRSQF